MAFKRIVEMKVGDSTSSFLISDLDITFDITRTRKFANNVAKFKIFGVIDDTINRVLQKGKTVSFSAGYEDEGIGLIYVGQIIQAVPSKNPPEKYVDIECGSMQDPSKELFSVVFSLAYKKDTYISRPINEIGNALGLAISGLENVSNIKLVNGFNLTGTAKEALRYIQGILERNGLIIFVDNSILVVAKKGVGNKASAVKLTSNTGLLEAPTLTDNTEGDEKVQEKLKKRVLFKSILNYRIIPNGYVNIENNSVKGVFIVDKCNYKGNNFGGDFFVSGEGIGKEN